MFVVRVLWARSMVNVCYADLFGTGSLANRAHIDFNHCQSRHFCAATTRLRCSLYFCLSMFVGVGALSASHCVRRSIPMNNIKVQDWDKNLVLDMLLDIRLWRRWKFKRYPTSKEQATKQSSYLYPNISNWNASRVSKDPRCSNETRSWDAEKASRCHHDCSLAMLKHAPPIMSGDVSTTWSRLWPSFEAATMSCLHLYYDIVSVLMLIEVSWHQFAVGNVSSDVLSHSVRKGRLMEWDDSPPCYVSLAGSKFEKVLSNEFEKIEDVGLKTSGCWPHDWLT